MSTAREAATAAPPDPLPVPESLLGPLLDMAAVTLARAAATDLPPVLRPLAGFDRRRLTSTPARQQLRRALDVDADFRASVVERFLEKPEVVSALEAWSTGSALRRVEDAAERSDLPWLASALYAARPKGWTFGLGMVCAMFDRERSEKERDDDVKAAEVRLGSAEEARRRAEDARDAARADVARLEEQLREERRSRREREMRSQREVEEAEQRQREAKAATESLRATTEAAAARVAREAERARAAEAQVRALRHEAAARPAPPSAELITGQDVDGLAQAAADTRRLAAALEGLARRARDAGSRPAAPAATATGGGAVTKRVRPTCPPGMRADSSEALDAMLRTRGIVLVVDGYNVSMAGWGDAAPADQRDRLVAALAGLHLRLRCDAVVVFDGADVHGVVPPRRTGVRVVFSAPGEEADPVVVREAAALPERVPVIVASSDQWVREQAEGEGATVVPAAVLLEVLRR